MLEDLTRRQFLAMSASAGLALLSGSLASAQTKPSPQSRLFYYDFDIKLPPEEPSITTYIDYINWDGTGAGRLCELHRGNLETKWGQRDWFSLGTSPNGEYILCKVDGTPHCWATVNVSDKISGYLYHWGVNPSFSPDSNKILYTAVLNYRYCVHIVNPKNPETDPGKGKDICLTEKDKEETDAIWVKDGIICLSRINKYEGGKSVITDWEITKMDEDGKNKVILPMPKDLEPLGLGDPSPDREKIILYTVNGFRSSKAMHVAGIDGKNIKSLISDFSMLRNAVWSPDSKKIVFGGSPTKNRSISGNNRLYVAEIDTGKITEVSNMYGFHGNPTWSPDSERIVFSHHLNDISYAPAYIVNRDGTGLENITEKYGVPKKKLHWLTVNKL